MSVAIIFEPQIKLLGSAVAPDAFDSSLGLIPSDNFVVSRHLDGRAASKFCDLSWNLTPYDPNGRSSLLNFAYWGDSEITPVRDQLAREIRWLIFLLIWKREGSTLSNGTLHHYLSTFRELARFCESKSCQIRDVLNDAARLTEYVDAWGYHARYLSSLLQLLITLGPEQVGFDVLGRRKLKELRQRSREYMALFKQHPPITSRIYSVFITALSCELDDFEAVADRYFALVGEYASDPPDGKSKDGRRKIVKKPGLNSREYCQEFPVLLRKYGLEDYFVAKGLPFHKSALTRGLAEVQLIAKLTIHTFSGMRDDEANSLPYECLETSTSGGKTHCIIGGRTTKLNEGKIKRTHWVTSREGHRAIRIAQSVADVIYQIIGDKPLKAVSRINDYPLFVSTGYLRYRIKSTDGKTGRYWSSKGNLSRLQGLREKLQPLIEESDLHELEQIDPNRAWRAENKFQVGKPWVLTTHQLRRSLALYAQRSGLVSLPTLRRQLQHLTEEMARYYARGSAFARNFIGDSKDHFGLEWQETQPVSCALSYLINVIGSEEALFGGHGNWIENRFRKGDEVVIGFDRQATMRRFKNGEMAYRETALGGCVNTGECNESALRLVPACLNGCEHLILKPSKLERVIVAQTVVVAKLDPASMEFRTEKADLQALMSARVKMMLHQKKSTEV